MYFDTHCVMTFVKYLPCRGGWHSCLSIRKGKVRQVTKYSCSSSPREAEQRIINVITRNFSFGNTQWKTTVTFVSSLHVEDSQLPLPLWHIKIPMSMLGLLSWWIWRFLSCSWKLQVPQPVNSDVLLLNAGLWLYKTLPCSTLTIMVFSFGKSSFFPPIALISEMVKYPEYMELFLSPHPHPQLRVYSHASGFRPKRTNSRWISNTSISLAKLSLPPQESGKGKQWVISGISFPSSHWAESKPPPVHEVATFVALTEVLGCKYITWFSMVTTRFWVY